jgi:glycosyltransferase involved in cell wall biosynthesis
MAATLYVNDFLDTFKSKVDAYITPSDFLRKKYIASGFSPEKLHLLPNFISPLPPREESPKSGHLVYVGRLSSEKGLKTLLQAMRSLPQWSLSLAGTGPLEAELKEFATKNNVANISFLGFLKPADVARLLQ